MTVILDEPPKRQNAKRLSASTDHTPKALPVHFECSPMTSDDPVGQTVYCRPWSFGGCCGLAVHSPWVQDARPHCCLTTRSRQHRLTQSAQPELYCSKDNDGLNQP